MTFDYVARDLLGKVLKGSVDASNREAAMQLLERDGFSVTKLESRQGKGDLFPRRVKKSEIIFFTNQLAIMVDTGINLSIALDGISEQEENPTFKRVMLDLRQSVEAGGSFSAALSKHPKYFDTTFVSLVRAGEETGSLAEMLDRIGVYQRKEMETRGKVRSALAYPTVMLVLAIGVTIFLLTYIMPKFTPLFERKGAQLPKPTVLMMSISELMIGYWYLWLIGFVVLIVGFFVGRRTEPGKKALDWVKINMPIMGPMFRKVTISRSIRTLGTMVGSGVQVLDAIRLSADVSGNHFYEQTWLHVHNEVTNGNRICDALAGNQLFPHTLVQMIGSGEETGKLDQVLNKVSAHYDLEVENSLKTVTRLIEPLMISVMGVVVGGIGMSLLLPIFSLSRGG